MNKAKAFIPSLLPLFAAAPAGATIIHFDDSNAFTVGSGSDDQKLWDINTDGDIDTDINFSGGGTVLNWSSLTDGQGQGLVDEGRLLNLSFGDSVSAGDSFGSRIKLFGYGNFDQVSGFDSGVSGYAGFSFVDSSNTHYGWARVTITGGSSGSITVHEWAYSDVAGASIQVGATPSAVPEPAAAATGLGLLALGAAGLRRSRSRKRVA